MPGRSYSSDSYRYGFNGQERSTELNDNSFTAEFWQYDARLGRRWNVDPVLKVYESPYATFANNPILLTDRNGDDAGDPSKHKIKKGENLTKIAKKYSTTVEQLLKINKGIKDKNIIQEGQTLNVPQFYNPNEIDNRTGLKREMLKHIDFKSTQLGFKSDEVNNFDYDVQISDRETSPTASGVATVINRLGDFLNGTGSTNMVYGPETEFAISAKKHYSIEKARTFFYNKYKYLFNGAETKEQKMGARNAFLNLTINEGTEATKIKGKWGISDIGKTGWAKNSWGMQFTGSCAINVFSSYDANRLIFVVANSTSLWSAAYHTTPNISRNKSVEGLPGSTILNITIWEEPIDFSRFLK